MELSLNVPEDSNNSDFEGGEGDPESGMAWESINIIYAENGHAIVHSIGYFNSFIMIHNRLKSGILMIVFSQ